MLPTRFYLLSKPSQPHVVSGAKIQLPKRFFQIDFDSLIKSVKSLVKYANSSSFSVFSVFLNFEISLVTYHSTTFYERKV